MALVRPPLFSPPWIALSLGVLLLSSCAATPPKPDVPPAPAQSPSLAAFVGTWQEGEPCEHGFARMILRQGDGVIEGEWAFFTNGWGLSTGSLRASPDGAYLMLDTCEDAATWGTHPPRYSEFACPELGFWHGFRGIRIDEATGELVVAFPDLSDSARMKRVGPDVAAQLQCRSVQAKD